MVHLQFAGKVEKLPFTYKNENIKNTLVFETMSDVVAVTDADAEWIFKFNPIGFVRKVEPPKMAVVAEKEKKPIPKKEPLICPHCSREYMLLHKKHYERHVKRCKGDGKAKA